MEKERAQGSPVETEGGGNRDWSTRELIANVFNVASGRLYVV